ncbi:MAG: HAD-IA family hydrolase [Myxococcota bacterium]
MSVVRLCALDLDGTLVDTVGDICFHANHALRELGLREQDEPTVRGCVGHGARELMSGLLREHQHLLDRAVRIFQASYEADPAGHSALFDGARELLEDLRARGVAAAVVTNKPRHISVRVLESLGVLPLLASVEGAAEGLPFKPDPTLLRRAADAVGAHASRTVMVGDSLVDVDTAAAFGCAFVGVGHGMDHGAGIRGRGLPVHGTMGEAMEAALRVLEAG